MKLSHTFYSLCVGMFFTIQSAYPHARLLPAGTLKPRTTNAGIKTGPCGGFARGLAGAPTQLVAGSQLVVQWEETINHPGYFTVAYSQAGDQNFNVLTTVVDNQNGTNNLPHSFSATITVPNQNCTDCTIQLIQYMTENVVPSLYYSCADIEIVGATGGPPPSPTPTPSSTTSPNCN